MTPATDVQEQIRRFVDGFISPDDLSDWLSGHAQAVLDTHDQEPRPLMDLAFSLLEDVSHGHRSEEEVRTILGQQVPNAGTPNASEPVNAGAGVRVSPTQS